MPKGMNAVMQRQQLGCAHAESGQMAGDTCRGFSQRFTRCCASSDCAVTSCQPSSLCQTAGLLPAAQYQVTARLWNLEGTASHAEHGQQARLVCP